MTPLDDDIRTALHADEDLSITGREPTLLAQVGETFRGRSRWLTWVVWTSILILTAIWFACIVRFLQVDAVELKLVYGVGVIFFGLAVAMQKLWYWMLLNRNAVLREIKRLELQIARLSGPAPGSGDRPA